MICCQRQGNMGSISFTNLQAQRTPLTAVPLTPLHGVLKTYSQTAPQNLLTRNVLRCHSQNRLYVVFWLCCQSTVLFALSQHFSCNRISYVCHMFFINSLFVRGNRNTSDWSVTVALNPYAFPLILWSIPWRWALIIPISKGASSIQGYTVHLIRFSLGKPCPQCPVRCVSMNSSPKYTVILTHVIKHFIVLLFNEIKASLA